MYQLLLMQEMMNVLDVTTEESDARGLAFNNNGTKMFVTGFNGDEVNEYDFINWF